MDVFGVFQKVAVPEGCEHVPLTKKPAKPAKVLEFKIGRASCRERV